MRQPSSPSWFLRHPWRVAILGLLAVGFFAAALSSRAGAAANVYAEKILVANRAGFAPDAIVDTHLVNPWGIALRPPGAGGHIWIGNAGNLSTSTYIGDVHGCRKSRGLRSRRPHRPGILRS